MLKIFISRKEQINQARAELIVRERIKARHGEILDNLDHLDTNIRYILQAVEEHYPDRRYSKRDKKCSS